MFRQVRQTAARSGAACVLLAISLLFAASAAAQTPPSPSNANLSLAERQRDVLARVQRLESTMLKLTKLLAESEPEKAERLRDALNLSGKQRIKSRVEALTQLLKGEKLSDADQQQSALLKDLDELLKTLTNPANELDARRQEREKLERVKRAIRTLMDEQTQNLYRTQQVQKQMHEGAEGAAGGGDAGEMLDKLEEMQRQTERKAAELQRELQPKPDEQNAARPGADAMREASERMREAADRLGDDKPAEAQKSEEQSLEKMQEALDELEDALRQARKEEMDETLSAIETRLRDLLTREKTVREAVRPLEGKNASEFSRSEQSQLVESAATQKQAADDCAQVLRIVVDEGTTVIVPELLRQLSTDMSAVAGLLEKSDPSRTAVRLLDDIVAQLEQMLAAVESRREKNREEENKPQQQQQQNQGPQPLLPGSAELKLLREAQVRLNERMPAAAGAAEETQRVEDMRQLSERQTQLVDLARRMNERKEQ